MISVFRKQLKNFTGFLWVVFASMALASLSVVVMRRPTPRETKIGTVNSHSIYLGEYQQNLIQIRMQLEMMQNYAREQGISPEFFMAMAGFNNPEEIAFKELINEKLVNKIHSNISLELDQDFLKNQIGKSLPGQLFDRTGHLNQQSYKEYLAHLQQTVEEYETKKEDELKRQFIVTCLKNAAYIPQGIIAEHVFNETMRKNFSILVVPIDSFLEKSEQTGVTDEELHDFYEKNKEGYRIPEKRKAEFWTVSKKEYLDKVTIEDQTIESFYTRNKDSLYRIPAEVKLRKLTVKIDNIESPESIVRAHKKVNELYDKITANPTSFEALIREHSDDTESAQHGGLIPFFKRGTYEDDFERAAFRLKEKGEFAKTAQIDDRFEIIQLIERKDATYKPLDSVRNEIVKNLRERKAGMKIKSDLDAVLYNLRSNKDAIDDFVKKAGLITETSYWLGENEAQGHSKMAKLAQKIFNKKKPAVNHGYFSHRDGYILFREIDRQRSFIPSFDEMKETVLEEFIGKRAQKEQKEMVATIRRTILDKKASLGDLEGQYNAQIIKSGFISRQSVISDLKDVPGLVEKIFTLSDQSQVAKHKRASTYYLAVLESASENGEMTDEEKAAFVDRESEGVKMRYFNAFIASLLRNARIEKYQNIPQYAPIAGDEDL